MKYIYGHVHPYNDILMSQAHPFHLNYQGFQIRALIRVSVTKFYILSKINPVWNMDTRVIKFSHDLFEK